MSNDNQTSENDAALPSNATLQHMLAFSTSLTNQENPNVTGPIDRERMHFFFNSLQEVQGGYQNDIEVIKQCLNTLNNSTTEPKEAENCALALQNILDLVDHIDAASDFMKLGGFPIVGKFLIIDNEKLVRLSAEIIGVSCQNHPHVQRAVVDDPRIFSDLISILKSSTEDRIKIKALFAISSIIQNNPAGHDKFKLMSGYEILVELLQTATISTKLRTCFVLDCLCSQFPEIKAILLEKNYISYLVDLLNSIPIEDSKETVLNALFTFIEGFYDAIVECKKKEYNLKALLEYLITHCKRDASEIEKKVFQIRKELDRFQAN